MASIPTADLDAALAEALQISTATFDGWTDQPYIAASAGAEGAGAHVAIVHGEQDALDIQGQLAARGWRINGGARVGPRPDPANPGTDLPGYAAGNWHRA